MTRPSALFSGEIVEASAPRAMIDSVHYTLTYDTATSTLQFTLLAAPEADNDIEFYAIRAKNDTDYYIPADSDYPVSVPFTPVTHPKSWRGKEGVSSWDATIKVGAVDDTGVLGRMIATAVTINTSGFITVADSQWSAMEITDPDEAGGFEGLMAISVHSDVAIPAGLELRAAARAAPYNAANRSLFHNIDNSPEIAPGESVTIATGGTEGTVVNAVLLFYEPEEGQWFQASQSVRIATLSGLDNVDLPAFTSGPTITGTGKIGTALTLSYTATGQDSAAIQWKRSGTVISGSTGSTYTVVAADDLLFVAATVTLTNAGGSRSATSNAIQATYAAPVLTGSISNVSETQQAGGSKTFDASTEFDATTGAYRVSPQNSAVTINSVTGIATVSLNDALAATTFTVFKTNSGGSASDTFTVTITASVPSIIWPATDPTASDVTVTEVTDPDEATDEGFPDESGHLKWVTSSFNFAPSGFTARIMPFDPSSTGTTLSASSTAYSSDFAAIGATVTPVVKWRHTASGTLKEVLTLPSIVIQGLDADDPDPDPDPTGFQLVPTATLNTALTANLTAYNTSNISSGAFSVFSTFMVAYAAWMRQPSAYSRCLAQLRNWCNGSRSPCGVAGFATKYECHAVGAIVLAKDTPPVWDELSSADKQRLDLIAKICIVAAAATSSDRRPSAVSGTTLLGRPANLSGNINFSLSYPTMVHLGCAYFGSAAALIDYLDGSGSGWAKTAFRTACNNLDLTNLVSALDAWTWTNAQVVTALTDPTIGGFAYSNIMGLMTASNGLPRAFGKTIRAGGGSDGQGVQFNGQTRGIIAAGAANLPNAGQVGMAQEFDGSDASEGPSSSNLRSAMTYVSQGTTLCMTWMLALATQGLLNRDNSTMQATIIPRITRGIRDIEYKNQQGYNSFAHGGDGPGNENWRSGDQGQTYQTSVLISAWRDVIEPWISAGEGGGDVEVPEGPLYANSIASTPFHYIHDTDPNAFTSVVYLGNLIREVPFQGDIPCHVYRVAFSDTSNVIEIYMAPNLEDGSSYANEAAARVDVNKYTGPLGRLPLIYRRNIHHMIGFAGNGVDDSGETLSSEDAGHFFMIYADRANTRIANNDLNASFFHEATHASIQRHGSQDNLTLDDFNYLASPEWAAAKAADNDYITTYATTADQEDFAEHALFAWVMIFHPERIPEPDRTWIAAKIPNRIEFFRTIFAIYDGA